MKLNPAAASDCDGWKTISSQTQFESDHLLVATEEVISPARAEPRSWTVVHRKAAVVVAPMTADGKLVLIRQERIPIRAVLWEVPAGQIDDSGADERSSAEVFALRELREKTGYELGASGKLTPLGEFLSSPGSPTSVPIFFWRSRSRWERKVPHIANRNRSSNAALSVRTKSGR